MDGKARVERQVASKTRDRVVFLDKLRTLHGFDAVASLTPKVETRLRAGDQPAIDLKVQYVASEIALELSIPRGFPNEIMEVTLRDLMVTGGDQERTRERKLGVIQEHLQAYLTGAAEESRLRGGQGDEGFSHDTSDDRLYGLQVIEKFNQASTYLNLPGDISLNGMGEVQESIFQFGAVREKLAGLGAGSGGEGDLDAGEGESIEGGGSEEEGQAPPRDTYRCKVCRLRLFDSADLEQHVPSSALECTSLFLSEACAGLDAEDQTVPKGLALLGDTGTSQTGNSGKVACARCGTRVGSWSWLGMPCSCKAWVCPGFQVVASKVDKS